VLFISHARLRVRRASGIPYALLIPEDASFNDSGADHAGGCEIAPHACFKTEIIRVVPDKRAKASAIRDRYAAAGVVLCDG
jgi:hypothetical protein